MKLTKATNNFIATDDIENVTFNVFKEYVMNTINSECKTSDYLSAKDESLIERIEEQLDTNDLPFAERKELILELNTVLARIDKRAQADKDTNTLRFSLLGGLVLIGGLVLQGKRSIQLGVS